MKKFLVMLMLGAFLAAGVVSTVGCGDSNTAKDKAKDKDKDKDKDKAKDKAGAPS